MDRGNIRDCVLRTLGRRLFRRFFGAAHKAARRQQGDKGEFSQCLHSLDFFLEGRSSVPAAFAASFRFVHSNGLHLLHRKWRCVSYKVFAPEGDARRQRPVSAR